MQQDGTPGSSHRFFSNALWYLVAIAAGVTPLAFSRYSVDIFRTPKDVVFQLFAVAIFALGAAGMLCSDRIAASFRTSRGALLIASAAVLWTAIAALLSRKPDVSLDAPLTVFWFAAYFIATIWAARERNWPALLALFAPAIANAAIAAVQEVNVWSPWPDVRPEQARLRASALLGNPNEVGAYFVLPLVAAFAAAIAWRKLWLYLVAIVLAGGLLLGKSVTSLGAGVIGLALIFVLPAARRLRWVAIGGLIVVVGAAFVVPGVRARLDALSRSISTGNMATLTSERAPAWVVAMDMFRERPLIGAGPGVFSADYMHYRVRIDERYPDWIRVNKENFGEVHNDHLQVLAETGVIGYAIFAAGLIALARLSFQGKRDDDDDPRATFVRLCAFPIAVAFAALAMGHFPLYLTSTMAPATYLAALCFAWTTKNEGT